MIAIHKQLEVETEHPHPTNPPPPTHTHISSFSHDVTVLTKLHDYVFFHTPPDQGLGSFKVSALLKLLYGSSIFFF